MSEWIEPLSERWFFSRLRYRNCCGVCGVPTGRRKGCKLCRAVICPRHKRLVGWCACLWQDVG